MYPIKIKQSDYRISIMSIFKDIINFVVASIISFRSPITLFMFLQKNFHF